MPTATTHRYQLSEKAPKELPIFTTKSKLSHVSSETLDEVNDFLLVLTDLSIERDALRAFVRLHGLEKAFENYFNWEMIQ